VGVLMLALLMSVNGSFGGDRAIKRVVVKDRTGKEVSSFGGSYALVIGVSEYSAGWPKLPGVKNDVAVVSKTLEGKGFKVTTLLDPDGAALEKGFEKFVEQYGNREDNRLLIYFAGHGHTITPKYGGAPLGYIVPTNAPDPYDDLSRFRRVSMSMKRIEEYSVNIDARHVLFLFDSCFSGSLFAISRAVPEHINYKTGKPVRQYITSGSSDETVPDVSIFRSQFVEALNGEGDVNGDGYVTGTELGEFLQESVVNYSRGSQHPQYGKIRHPRLDKGDFVFLAGGSVLTEQQALATAQSKRAETGSLSVTTSPTGADILIDGIWEGVSPLNLASLRTGVIVVQGEKKGYDPESKKLRIRKDRNSKLTLVLDKRVEKGTLTIEPSPADARIRVLNIGPAYIAGMALKAGSYKIEVSREGYRTKEQTIDLSAGEDVQIAISLEKNKAKGSQPGDNMVKDPTTGMEFVFVKGGCYQMGSPPNEKDHQSDEAQHTVCVDDFWMSKYEVTNRQYRRYRSGHDSGAYKGKTLNDADQPVVQVSWEEASAYATWLSGKSNKKLSLPTEAQWEYAARGGTTAARYWGDSPDSACGYANVHDQTSKRVNKFDLEMHNCDDGYAGTAPVGRFRPNAYGLHDMLGNVWEWCSDWYAKDYYASSPRNNPQGASSGSYRVLRGGSWNFYPRYVRSAFRHCLEPGFRNYLLGFRLVLSEGK
jgi:formylglycine-generating enzyme required for sulfatase activity